MCSVYALVAQLDRVTGYEPVGRGFESLPARQNPRKHLVFGDFSILEIFQLPTSTEPVGHI